jgi:Na+-driven multidrug efflux pump
MFSKDKLSTAISSALALALLVGFLQLVVFTIGASQILAMTGVSHSSTMYLPAVAFMRARASAAPSATIWLVATNAFRGK